MSAPGRIFLWDAGRASGTAGSPEGAFTAAAPYLAAGAAGLVEEAEVEMLPAGAAGSVPGYRRTGKAWAGQLNCGVPSWERVPAPAGPPG